MTTESPERNLEERKLWCEERLKSSIDEQRVALQAELGALDPDVVGPELLGRAMPALRVVAFPGPSSGESHLGGQPAMPRELEWPRVDGRPLAFLAQLRLDQLPRVADFNLPAEGQLLFFYDAVTQPWGFDPADASGWRVMYLKPGATLAPRPFPAALPEDARFTECRLAFVPVLTLPSVSSESVDEDEYCARLNLESKLEGEKLPLHQVGGWPKPVQGDMEEECERLTRWSPPPKGRTKTELRADIEEGARDWVLLLQLDTDEVGPNWMWGDCGRLYFWIRRQDLNDCNFTSVWVMLQCG